MVLYYKEATCSKHHPLLERRVGQREPLQKMRQMHLKIKKRLSPVQKEVHQAEKKRRAPAGLHPRLENS